jgi:hypothetical protein
MRAPAAQLQLFTEVIETAITRDRMATLSDGSTASFRQRPGGPGWVWLRDHERRTTWQRRRPVVAWRPRRRGGGREPVV